MDKSLGAEAPPPWTSCRVSLRNGATVMDISERFLHLTPARLPGGDVNGSRTGRRVATANSSPSGTGYRSDSREAGWGIALSPRSDVPPRARRIPARFRRVGAILRRPRSGVGGG